LHITKSKRGYFCHEKEGLPLFGKGGNVVWYRGKTKLITL